MLRFFKWRRPAQPTNAKLMARQLTLEQLEARMVPSGTNLIVNGDFEQGYTGYTTGYVIPPTSSVGGAGQYLLVTDPGDHGPGIVPPVPHYGDHTTGTGLMMMLNGSHDSTTVVWSETVSVVANSTYDFALWLSSWTPSSPATLDIQFNGVSIGTPTAPSTTAVWQQFATTWNSGSSTSLTINIFDTNTADVGNDFALDDISLFAEKSMSMTTVSSSANASILGQLVTFTATVQSAGSSSATPSGSVDFVDTTTNTDLGSVPLSGGSASKSTSALSVGAHVIQANYGGDASFLPSTGSLMQNVDYDFIGFLPPLDHNLTIHAGRTVPVKFQLADYNGNFISSLSAVTALQVLYPDGSTHAIPGLRYDAADNQFIANWRTDGLSPGSYTISLSLLDGTTHTATVQIASGPGTASLIAAQARFGSDIEFHGAATQGLSQNGFLLIDPVSFMDMLDVTWDGRSRHRNCV
jgi:hypothetical protein